MTVFRNFGNRDKITVNANTSNDKAYVMLLPSKKGEASLIMRDPPNTEDLVFSSASSGYH
ncbi:hypothetical protein EF405_07275 [Cyclobacteriaceae bacterium YHN15]|nr:hypothetical protein EF405_07275 [Cyclobacteriaceae bacterium YHN15]